MRTKLLLLGLLSFSTIFGQSSNDVYKKALQFHLGINDKVNSIYRDDTVKLYYVTGFSSVEREFFLGKKRFKVIDKREIDNLAFTYEKFILFQMSIKRQKNNCYLVAISDFMVEKEGTSSLQTYYHGVQYFFKKDNKGKYNFIRSVDVTP